VASRRIQPKPTVELETVTLRLPVQLVRAVDHYGKYLGGSTNRTYFMAQAIEIAMAQDRDFTPGGTRTVPPVSFRNTAVFTPALSAVHVRPSSPLRP
jgi:hypothetical protein